MAKAARKKAAPKKTAAKKSTAKKAAPKKGTKKIKDLQKASVSYSLFKTLTGQALPFACVCAVIAWIIL